MSLVDGDHELQILLLEYEQIKSEQRSRIGFRDNLLYVTLASIAAVISTSVTSLDRVHLLLLLPPISVILGWTYVANDQKISSIGMYIREHLASKVSEDYSIFGWESFHREDRHRGSRKWFQLFVDLLAFCISPLVALIVFWVLSRLSVPLLVLSIFELTIVVILAHQIVRYSSVDILISLRIMRLRIHSVLAAWWKERKNVEVPPS